AAAPATGLNPQTVISADFNGDGNLDLATANYSDGTVSVLLGNGDGTFTPAPNSPFSTGSGPYSLAVGYFDSGNTLDLAVTNVADNTVSVFLGKGDGTFPTSSTYPVGHAPSSVATGDFDGDGTIDIAVANQNDHTVSILLNDGSGNFPSATSYLVGTSDLAGLTTGDFNGDHKLDLAVTSPTSDMVFVLVNNGVGTFAPPMSYSTGNPLAHPVAVAAVDLNSDSKLDLAVANLNAKTVAIFLGNGDGTFQAAVPYSTTTGSIGPDAIATGDFDGDGKTDLAISEQDNNTVSILLGNGNGSLQNPLEFSAGNVALSVAAGDFNRDGRLDLAVA